MFSFKFKKEDMDKMAIIVPPFPILDYKWRQLVKLNRSILYLLLFLSIVFIGLLSFSAYIGYRIFVLDSDHTLWQGNLALPAGVVYSIFALKLAQHTSKLAHFLLKGKQKHQID